MICEKCQRSIMEYRFFPAGAWVCPACGYENDTDEVQYQDQEDKGND